ncbi:energy-coupling factor transporter transmembrane protein EcfT [Cohnella sp. CFH 77786]|uniref:energy-coupling factor transporter transmembrane component T family protein n=1 Tax=Cohnella sp. CFH 77786 TaxID=2662265 RepID=UPI001C60E98B|nr:energy-coupling factor transporter transmembrane component T [Cohnella sp. CFH 77786]MBW5448663.1 energy-coupling factor transporter transmembrane protein EcfT [Cohnella sp. CFH 77786]
MSEGFGLRSLHPSVLLLYYAGGITFGMLLFHPVLLLSGWAACLIVNGHLDGGREWRSWSLPMLGAFVALILVNPLISHRGRTVLYYMGDIPITLESVVYGATMASSLLGLLTLFVSYRILMTEHKFLFLFARFSPKAALLAMMAAGMVPRLRRRLKELMLVQKTRGIAVSEGTVTQRARNGARLVGALLSWSLEDALQTADSMQARGYGTGTRSSYPAFRFGPRDAWTAGGLFAAAGIAFTLWANGHGYLTIYPRLESFSLSKGDVGALAAYLVFLLMPLGWEWRDRTTWRSLNFGK